MTEELNCLAFNVVHYQVIEYQIEVLSTTFLVTVRSRRSAGRGVDVSPWYEKACGH